MAVLGAGMLGCCLALELAQRGVQVRLIDARPEALLGASTNNEGKLHLGFVYANDPERATHELMVRGSLAFAPIVCRLTGAETADFFAGSLFRYAVPRDSQLSVEGIEAHFDAVAAALARHGAPGGPPGFAPAGMPCYRRCGPDEHRHWFSHRHTLASFETVEPAVSTRALAAILRRAIAAEPRIHFEGGSEAVSISLEESSGVLLRTRRNGVDRERRFRAAANCLWDGRLTLDATAGIRPQRPWLFRYKATARIRHASLAAAPIPSATLVLGPYGDVVSYGDGEVYVSWYPSFKLGQTAELDGRGLHRLLEHVDRAQLARTGIAAMVDYVPGMAALLDPGLPVEVGGGVIFAWGCTDIDDRGSGLHQRFAIGPSRHGPYVTVDTGKYCTAPLFAVQTADLLAEVLA